MEYVIVFILQALGISLSATQKMLELDRKFPDDSLSDVINLFLREDRITLIISGIILIFNLVAHYIVDSYTELPLVVEYYPIWAFGISFVLGYAGQRIIYKYLGKAEGLLMKKADKLDGI